MRSCSMWEFFLWRWDPVWAGVLLAIALFYEGAIRYLPTSSPEVRTPTKIKRFAFYSGLVLCYAALGSPLAPMAHLSFSMHMLRLSLICWFSPPLILLGLPPGLLRPLGKGRIKRMFFSFLTRPLIALVPFHIAFFIIFYPPVFDALAFRPQETAAEGWLVLTAYLMWWPVFCPIHEWDRLSEWKKMIYLTISALLLTPVSFWLLFAEVSLYNVYDMTPNPFNLDPISEQKIAGAWMKLVQVFLFGGAFTYWFVRWVQKEQRRDPINRKKAEQEAIARLLLNKRVTYGDDSPKKSPAGKSPAKVIHLSDRRRKKNPRIDT